MVKRRQAVLIFAMIVGVLAICGSAIFATAGAGIYGSPFAGDTYFNVTLLLVLLFGPVLILPCTILDYHRPVWGGTVLCTLAIVEVILISLNNLRPWGFAIHDAALGAFFLALPMFVIGTMLNVTSDSSCNGLKWIWRIEAVLVVAIAFYFCWQVGIDGVSGLFHLLRGGLI